MSILAILERGRAVAGDGPAIIAEGEELGYAELAGTVAGMARGLASHGLARGAHGAILSHNRPKAFCAALAVMAAGGVYVPINSKSTEAANAAVMNALDCELLFYDPAFEASVAVIRQELPGVRLWLPLDDRGIASLTADGAAWPGELPVPALDDMAWLGQTGGTTGLPKGVQLSWRAIYGFLGKIAIDLPEQRPVMLVATPMTHAAGMLALPMLLRGGRIVMHDKFEPRAFLDAIGRHRVSTTFLPPTAIYRLLDTPGVEQVDYSSLRHFIFAAAPMAVPRLREALSVFGPVMAQVYGQSECHTFVTVMRPTDYFVGPVADGHIADDRRLASCGRASLGTIIEIRDDEGRLVEKGSPGEICVMSDLAMSGYYRNPEETAHALRDGFVHTGDVGILDEDGYLRIVDRKKDLVISGGVNIYPSEIEQVLGAHEAVAECAVVGLPDADWGEVVTAVARLKPEKHAEPKDLIGFVRARLGPINCPKRIHIWPDLPRSGVGKILKAEIRHSLLEGRVPEGG